MSEKRSNNGILLHTHKHFTNTPNLLEIVILRARLSSVRVWPSRETIEILWLCMKSIRVNVHVHVHVRAILAPPPNHKMMEPSLLHSPHPWSLILSYIPQNNSYQLLSVAESSHNDTPNLTEVRTHFLSVPALSPYHPPEEPEIKYLNVACS